MNWSELLKAALVLVVSFALKWFLGLIGVSIDEALFNTLVGAIVVYVLSLFGVDVARARAAKYFK